MEASMWLLKTEDEVLKEKKMFAASSMATGVVINKQPHYIYRPLSNEGDSIRLVRLLPTDCPGKVACILLEHRLSKLPIYQALSYEWGKADEFEWIVVDGQEFRVQRNLLVFLRRIRPTIKDDQMIFVDAICVNQGDLQERNAQVMLMGRIYQGAREVLVWLGPAAEKSEELYKMHEATTTLPQNMLQKRYVEIFGSSDKKPMWRALAALIHRSYWHRMWIVQEILLAHDITLFCGTWQASWDEFEQLLTLPSDIIKMSRTKAHFTAAKFEAVLDTFARGPRITTEDMELELQTCRLASFVSQRRINYGSPLILSLPDLVESYGQSSCTDIRDRIYGLLGIAKSSPDGYRLVADYGNNETSLFFDVLQCYQPTFPVRFGRTLHWVLQLDSEIYRGEAEDLAARVKKSLPRPLGPEAFSIDLEYEGQLIGVVKPKLQPIFPSWLTRKAPPVLMRSFKVAKTTNKRPISSTGKHFRLSPDLLFTCAPAKAGDHIIRVSYSECALIFRITYLDPYPDAPYPRWRRSDGSVASEPWEYTLLGRGVLLKASRALEAQRFLEKDFEFCADLVSGYYYSIRYLLSEKRKSQIWVGALDLLIMTASIDKSSGGRWVVSVDAPAPKPPRAGHSEDHFETAKRLEAKRKCARKLGLYLICLSHKLFWKFKSCKSETSQNPAVIFSNTSLQSTEEPNLSSQVLVESHIPVSVSISRVSALNLLSVIPSALGRGTTSSLFAA
jgi:hypothetical protein